MKVLLLAGEESGLLYADRLKQALAGCEFRTYQDLYKTSDLAVMGFWPVIKRIFFFLGVQRTMRRTIREWRPDAVVTIDYPGLNLKLAAYAKSRGIPAIHIVCPQVWAWHQNRIPKVAAAVNRLLCFFPFEPALFKDYEGKDFHAAFIGHPMVDVFKEEQACPNTQSRPLVAMLPGSRIGEIQRILPRLLGALHLIPHGVEAVVPAANDGAFAEITNRLDYILAAVPPSAINEAIAAATRRMEHNLARIAERRGA